MIESSGDESTPEDEEESLSTAHIGSSFLTTEQTATEANPTIPQVDTTQVASNAANSFSVLTIPLKPVIPNAPKILAALKNKTKDKINIPDSLTRSKTSKIKTESTKAIQKGQNYTEEWSRCALEMEERFTEIIGTCKGAIDEGWKTLSKQQRIIDKQAKDLSVSTDKINRLELQISALKKEVSTLTQKKKSVSSKLAGMTKLVNKMKDEKDMLGMKLMNSSSMAKKTVQSSDDIIRHKEREMNLKLSFMERKEEQKQKTEAKKQEQKMKTRKEMQSVFAGGSFGGLLGNTVSSYYFFDAFLFRIK